VYQPPHPPFKKKREEKESWMGKGLKKKMVREGGRQSRAQQESLPKLGVEKKPTFIASEKESEKKGLKERKMGNEAGGFKFRTGE